MEEECLITYTFHIPFHDQDLEQKDVEVKEAQRQEVECHRRLQLAKGEAAQVRTKLEAVNKRQEEEECEKAYNTWNSSCVFM